MRILSTLTAALCVPALLLVHAQNAGIEKLAQYYPTPLTVVDRMLQFGGLKAGETMFDLGSRDGRIVILAAQKYKAKAIDGEFDDSLFRQSMDRIKILGLTSTAKILNGDLLQ